MRKNIIAGNWKMNGGLRLACNEERWNEVKRQATTATSFGLEMLGRDECVELLAVEHAGNEMRIAVHLAPALAGRGVGEARIAHHHRLHVGLERAVISGSVGADQI